MHIKKPLLFAFTVLTIVSLACSQSPAGPAAPSSTEPGAADALPDGATLKATQPTPMEPIGGIVITDLDPDLVVGNSQGMFVSDLPLSYVFEVRDEDGRVAYTSPPIPAGPGGQTRHEVGLDLEADEVHTWRAWAVYQGQRGPFSTTASFKTFDRFGVSCAHMGSEIGIVGCRKAQYVQIPHDKLPEFLERVANDLNVANMEHAPYGRLIKVDGNNCHGYSCDIICSDRGQHRQWDVLIDEDGAQIPGWSRVGEPTPRPCQIP